MILLRLLCLVPLLATFLSAQSDFALKDGDTVVFYGDSITDQRLYTTFAETYAVTRFPDRKIRFVHSGWGGDRVTGGGGGNIDTRLQRDVIAYKPTVMTVMLGMNDAGYRALDEPRFQTYRNGYAHIVDVVTKAAPNVRLTLIQPSPYDDVTRAPLFTGGYNQVLLQYADFIKQLAQKNRATVADLNTAVVAMLQKANSADASLAQKIIPDRVHPGPSGHLIMAEALLRAWGAPAIVTAVEIDAASGQAARADNTKVSNVQTGKTITWTQQDRALPFPIDVTDPAMALVVRSSDVIEALDQQPLRVRGLAAARYSLTIDGQTVGTFSKEDLAAGINLATQPTPMRQQAANVHALTLKRANVHNARWRIVQVPLQDDHLSRVPAALDAMDALDNELATHQRAAAQPQATKYVLTPQ